MTATRVTEQRGGDCHDGSCPAWWDTDDPEMVVVQGAKLAAPLEGMREVPDHETAVLIPRSVLFGHDAR
jgi:hypothetical protein